MNPISNLQSQISNYQSPFTTRYGSEAMRAIWSERNKRLLWRRIWVALAEAEQEMGIVTAEQVADLRTHAEEVTEASIARALEIEQDIQHDLMAEVRAYAEQCAVGGGIIHLGATSMDIEDNADALRLRDALTLIHTALRGLIAELAGKVDQYAALPTMAFTHLQPAEPTTVGYRLAQYLQDLLMDLDALRTCLGGIKGKGLKGAVGTSASYMELGHPRISTNEHESIGDDSRQFVDKSLEERVLAKLGLEAFTAATQTYTRKQDWLAVNVLAGIAQSLYKFAFDLRILQSPPIGEWAEPFGAKQVGSSAMPFKRNPINAEKIDSLARFMAGLPRVMWDNAAHSLLERTLDDSANRRVVLAEAFLSADEIIPRGHTPGEGPARERGAGGAQHAGLWPLRRHRAIADGLGQGRGRPAADARADPPAQPASLGQSQRRRAEPAHRFLVRRPAGDALCERRRRARPCWMPAST